MEVRVMFLERNEINSIVTYKRNGEIVGMIIYNNADPSERAFLNLAKRISHLYKESRTVGSK